ncbi:MAG: hypothetical protein KBC21_02965, partial [Candidatus Pacebacteria bacterium]|nr:hypothetical protein [Candidatus Paceibacterota bacterium]
MSLPLRVLTLFSVIFIIQATSSFAYATKSVYRGNSVNISWDVTNTTAQYSSCSRESTYPPSAVKTAWYGGGAQDPSGSVGLPAITEVNGSPFSFYCSNSPSGAFDEVILTVIDCPDIPGNGPGYIWNGSSCVNPVPSVDISAGAAGVDIGGSVVFSSNGSDQGNDLTAHNFDWAVPSGSWNWQNGNQGGSTDSSPQSSFGGTSASSRSVTFTPNTPGVYTLRFSVLDNNGTRWTSSSEVTLTVCDYGDVWNGSACTNPTPTVSISPASNQGVDIGDSITYSSSANDARADITGHNFDWATPSGTWNWQNGNAGGSTNVSPQATFARTASSDRSVTFTPTIPGVYTVRFSAEDYRGSRWTQSSSYTLTVCDADHRWVAGWCQPVVKINSFSHTPASIPDVDKGESTTLSWNIQGAVSCSLNGGQYSNTSVGTANTGSVTTNNLTTAVTYTLTCQGIAGPVSSQTSIVIASGTLSSPTNSCFIALNQSTCPVTLTWNSSNMSTPRVTNPSDVTIFGSSSGTNQSAQIPYGNTEFSLKNGGYVHSTVTTSATCIAGAIWSGTSCVLANQDPLGTFDGGTCTITGWACDPDDFSSPIYVDLKVGGVSIGTPLANQIRSGIGASCGSNTYHGFTFAMPAQYGNNTPVTVSATAINTPTGNNSSIGTKSVTCNNITGALTMSAPSCVIANGASTCTVGATWTTTYAGSPSLVNSTGATLATDANQLTPFTVYAAYPSTTYTLKNGSTTLDTEIVTTSCAGGTQWNGSTCAPTAMVTIGPLTASPSTVNYSQNTTLAWSGIANATACTLNGGQYSNVSVGTLATGSRTTNALTTNTTYTLTCQGPGGPVSSSVTANVASGDISSNIPSCLIALGLSSCSITINWNSFNMTDPEVLDNNGTSISTNTSGSSPRPIANGTITFSLRNDTFVHDSVTVSASCATGGTWSVVNSKCEPTSSVTIGPLTASPSTVNYSQSTTLAWSGVANATACTLNGGQYSNVSVGTAPSDSRVTNALTANTTYTLTCQGNGGPVSSVVTTNVASGDISTASSTCTIAIGGNTCGVLLSWTTVNITAPRVTNSGDTTLYSTPSGTNISRSISYGATTFSLKNGTFSHDSVTITADCASGSAWNGVLCSIIAPDQLSGILTVSSSSCAIVAYASTCTVTATWVTNNNPAPRLVDNNIGSTLSTLANQAVPTTITVAYGGTTFSLQNGATILDTKLVAGVCAAGTSWVNTRCMPISPVTVGPLLVAPSFVNYGGTAELSWSGVSAADSCTLSGGEFINEPVGNSASGTRTTSPLTEDTAYTLTCLGYNGPAISSAVAYVASGNISASPTSCIINVYENSCQVGVTWDTINMQSPRLTDSSNTTLSTSPSGIGIPQSVTYGSNTFAIKNGSVSHDSVLVNATCDSSSKWNGTICAPASATINSANCIIAKNTPTCALNVRWSSINTSGTITVTRPYAGNTIFATGNSGDIPASFPAGQFDLEVRQGSLILNTGTYIATCAAGSEWNGTICAETPEVTVGLLSATPSVVDYGDTTTLSWNGVANATACTLNGGEFTNTSVGTSETGTRGTGALTSGLTYTLTCQGLGGPKNTSVVVSVASGNITATPPSCTIPKGQSSCPVDLNWVASNMSSPRVTSSLGELVSLSGVGINVRRLIANGATTFSLSNGALVHSSFTATASCESGSAWDGTVCAFAATSINSDSCTIALGASTCGALVSWLATNTSGNVRVTGPFPSNTVLYSNLFGDELTNFSYGTNYLSLKLDGITVATGTYIATCAAGSLWSGALCSPSGISGNLTVSSNECLIPTGFSDCRVNATWVTSGANNPGLYNDTTGGSALSREDVQIAPLPVVVRYPTTRFVLKDNTTPLDFENVEARCAVGGWDGLGAACANPSVLSAVVTGQYYQASGNISLSCSNANRYRVVRTETGTRITPGVDPLYTGSVDISVSQTGNYTIYCIQGNYLSSPVVRYYNGGPAPSPTIMLTATPRTVSKASDATISWSIQHPKASCNLGAKTICQNGLCNEEQLEEATTINRVIQDPYEYVDTPKVQSTLTNVTGILTGTTRNIRQALTTIPSERTDTDWKTDGKRTFNIKYSTEFVLSCGDQV